jgi:hypothetical protein
MKGTYLEIPYDAKTGRTRKLEDHEKAAMMLPLLWGTIPGNDLGAAMVMIAALCFDGDANRAKDAIDRAEYLNMISVENNPFTDDGTPPPGKV